MCTNSMARILATLLASITAVAEPVTITYQGHLMTRGSPSSASHNMKFRLCASKSPQNVLQSFPAVGTIPVNPTTGLFTQELRRR